LTFIALRVQKGFAKVPQTIAKLMGIEWECGEGQPLIGT